jgi:3'-phosphoadenosine 5'-phosphosulfate sulfotransferase (PAPS reductase)/FAD synthetase
MYAGELFEGNYSTYLIRAFNHFQDKNSAEVSKILLENDQVNTHLRTFKAAEINRVLDGGSASFTGLDKDEPKRRALLAFFRKAFTIHAAQAKGRDSKDNLNACLDKLDDIEKGL